MILYMVGKLAPNSSQLSRGLVKYAPRRGYFRAVFSQNGDKLLHPRPPPQSLNGSSVKITGPRYQRPLKLVWNFRHGSFTPGSLQPGHSNTNPPQRTRPPQADQNDRGFRRWRNSIAPVLPVPSAIDYSVCTTSISRFPRSGLAPNMCTLSFPGIAAKYTLLVTGLHGMCVWIPTLF